MKLQSHLSVFRPRIAAKGEPLLAASVYPAPNQIAVVALGDPLIHIVDIRTGRTTRTLNLFH